MAMKAQAKVRRYLHTFDEAVPYNQMPGTFTPWQELPESSDVLFYEGLHGGVVDGEVNVAQHVDFLMAWCLSSTLNGFKNSFATPETEDIHERP